MCRCCSLHITKDWNHFLDVEAIMTGHSDWWMVTVKLGSHCLTLASVSADCSWVLCSQRSLVSLSPYMSWLPTYLELLLTFSIHYWGNDWPGFKIQSMKASDKGDRTGSVSMYDWKITHTCERPGWLKSKSDYRWFIFSSVCSSIFQFF